MVISTVEMVKMSILVAETRLFDTNSLITISNYLEANDVHIEVTAYESIFVECMK